MKINLEKLHLVKSSYCIIVVKLLNIQPPTHTFTDFASQASDPTVILNAGTLCCSVGC